MLVSTLPASFESPKPYHRHLPMLTYYAASVRVAVSWR